MKSLQFLGASGTVTGSKYLLTTSSKKVLIDCGMFQGLKSLRLKNWDKFPVDPSTVDAIILTHAHIDHSGYIPRFIRQGFQGKIYSTPATKDLCEILLPDAGHIAEEEANYLNMYGKSKHHPALPLFTIEEGRKALTFFQTVPFDQIHKLGDDFEFEFNYAGHILGAASVHISAEGTKICFTGDIGRPNDPIFFAPKKLHQTDYFVTESTYGNRRHQSSDVLKDLTSVINESVQKN